MFLNIGNLLILTGLIFSLVFIIIYIVLIFKGVQANILKQIHFFIGFIPLLLTLTASLYLLSLFLQDNFQSVYVYNFSSSNLPYYYKISAFWAGNSGSLLFWQLITTAIAFYILTIGSKIKELPCKLQLYIGLIIQFKISFFYLLLLIPANPFYFFDFIPLEGSGLNPMLQSPSMILHPPLTFLGYAGAFIPFVVIVAGLAARIDLFEIKKVRNIIQSWTLFAWFFLTIGIIIGAQWAYYELGWGGYWSWDPVENASLLPWLFLTAVLHGLIIFKHTITYKLFSTLLILGAYLLTIFATFITRSQLLDSVHAFGEQTMGEFFFVFLLVAIIISLILLLSRRNLLKNRGNLEKITSRQGFLILTNISLVVFAGAVFLATIFPLISKFFIEGHIIIGRTYYDQIAFLIGALLIGLLGFCYFLPWRGPSKLSTIINKNRYYFLSALIIIVLTLLANIFWFELAFRLLIFRLLSVLVIIALIYHFIRDTIVYWQKKKFSYRNLKEFFFIRKRRFSIIIIHLGIMILILGLSGYSQQREYFERLEAGEKIEIENYSLEFIGIEQSEEERNIYITSMFNLYYQGEMRSVISSKQRFHPAFENPHTSVGVNSSWQEDFYLVLGNWSETENVNIQVRLTPLVRLIWLGSYIIYGGFLLLILPKKI